MEGDKLVFRGLIASPDGKLFYDTTREGKPEDAAAMGHDAGMELKVHTSEMPAPPPPPQTSYMCLYTSYNFVQIPVISRHSSNNREQEGPLPLCKAVIFFSHFALFVGGQAIKKREQNCARVSILALLRIVPWYCGARQQNMLSLVGCFRCFTFVFG